MAPTLKAESISSGYGSSRIIHDITIEINEEDKLAVIGRNGEGKTTLLRTLMLNIPLETGNIVYFGNSGIKPKTSVIVREGMAYVPQGREIFGDFTVQENLNAGGFRQNKKVRSDNVERVLEYFPSLKPHLNRKGGILSGGLQQQLAISRALMGEPKLLLLDEPTEGIQPNIVSEIVNILNRVHAEMKLPLILVEQNLKFAFRIANRFVILKRGCIAASGNSGELTDDMIKQYLTV